MKTCSKCKVQKEYSEFNKNKSTPSGLAHRCRQCRKEEKLQETVAGKTFEYGIKYRYGLSKEGFDRILAAQGGKCKICKQVPDSKVQWRVDHNHACCPDNRSCGKCVRGILCGDCNIMVGFVEKARRFGIEEVLSYVDTPRGVC